MSIWPMRILNDSDFGRWKIKTDYSKGGEIYPAGALPYVVGKTRRHPGGWIDLKRNVPFLCALAALTMAYGWGYRGVVGHEAGAAIAGGMLGIAVCLGSGRLDWHRRAAVAGLCGAVGWAWGGTLSYMEHTLYTVTDTFPDVLYGYAMLFFLGGLWAGTGGAILGLAFTVPQSRLRELAVPLVPICGAFFATYLFFQWRPEVRHAYEIYTARAWHDGEWLAAATTLMVSGIHWLVRPADRRGTSVYLWCAAGWWAGYLSLTYFGGLRLAPPYRSESWGGLAGVLVILLAYLTRERNHAALLLARYGLLGGALAFPLAVFIRHPVRVSWGPFAEWGGKAQWKLAEESFGFLMGLAIALGVARLLRGKLKPAEENEDPKPLNVFAVFVLLVALMWMNLRRAPMDWLYRYKAVPNEPLLGMLPWAWYLAGGAVLSLVILYGLHLYRRGALVLSPPSAYGKGAWLLILLMWVTVVAAFVEHQHAGDGPTRMLVDASFILLSVIVTLMVLWRGGQTAEFELSGATTSASDPKWKAAIQYWLAWLIVPPFLLVVTGASMAMQDKPAEGAHWRFGERAYWREQSNLVGVWKALHFATDLSGTGKTTEGIDVKSIELRPDQAVVVVMRDGTILADRHQWFGINHAPELRWNGRDPDAAKHYSVRLTIRDRHLHIPWPPNAPTGYLVLAR